MMRKFAVVAPILFWLFSAASAAAAPKVVVTIKPIHALVAEIMRGVGNPVLLVEGAASPHTFALKPSTARAITEADVFIRVSEAVEPFTRKILAALPATVTSLTLAEAPGVRLIDQRHGGTFEKHVHDHHEDGGADHDAADDHDEGQSNGKDGHIWLDPVNAKAIVAAVTKALVARYPESGATFNANAAALMARLDDFTGELNATLAPIRAKPFIVFHDATQYLEARFGLRAAGSITVSPDVPPSAKRLTEVRHKIADLGAVCVFTEPSFQPKLVAAVTEGTRARSGALDVEGQLLTPGPELYFELMRGLARSLVGCLNAPA